MFCWNIWRLCSSTLTVLSVSLRHVCNVGSVWCWNWSLFPLLMMHFTRPMYWLFSNSCGQVPCSRTLWQGFRNYASRGGRLTNNIESIWYLYGTALVWAKTKKRKDKECGPTNNIADVLFSEKNETPVAHVHITIKKGFLLWRTHCSYKKYFYCGEHTVPQGSYVMRSLRYKATDCTRTHKCTCMCGKYANTGYQNTTVCSLSASSPPLFTLSLPHITYPGDWELQSSYVHSYVSNSVFKAHSSLQQSVHVDAIANMCCSSINATSSVQCWTCMHTKSCTLMCMW